VKFRNQKGKIRPIPFKVLLLRKKRWILPEKKDRK